MKILLVANGISRAGTSRVLSLLSQEWEKDHDVQVSLFRREEGAYTIGGKIIQNGIPLRGCVLSQIFYLYKILKKEHFDRVIGFSEDANYPLVLAAKLAGITEKTVLTVHNPVQKFSKRVTKRVSRVYGYAHKVIGVSKGVRDGLISLGVPSEKAVFKPNPIDLKMVDFLLEEKASVHLPTDKTLTRFISVGRLHHHKGFDLLIEAFSIVHSMNVNVRLYLVGEGGEKLPLEAKIASLNLQGKVILLGAHENPFSIIKQADIYVMSSRLEGWPLVLMEAMAVSKPVISFNCPNGPDEIIENSTQGILVPCGNVEALASEMMSLSKDKARQTALGLSARERIVAFDVKKIAQQWLN